MQLAPISESQEEACQAHWHTRATSYDRTQALKHTQAGRTGSLLLCREVRFTVGEEGAPSPLVTTTPVKET